MFYFIYLLYFLVPVCVFFLFLLLLEVDETLLSASLLSNLLRPTFFWSHLAARYLDGALIITVLSPSGTGTANWIPAGSIQWLLWDFFCLSGLSVWNPFHTLHYIFCTTLWCELKWIDWLVVQTSDWWTDSRNRGGSIETSAGGCRPPLETDAASSALRLK